MWGGVFHHDIGDEWVVAPMWRLLSQMGAMLMSNESEEDIVSKATKTSAAQASGDTAAVDAFMARLEHPLKAEIEAVRAIVLNADARVHESIKWNAPSFATTEHFATFKLRPATTLEIVFHTGAKVKAVPTPIVIDDPAGLLRWVTVDRCVARFANIPEIETHRDALVSIVRQWIAQV